MWTSLRAIIGDDSDGMSGVKKGVGPKTAVKYLNYGLNPKLRLFKQHPIQPLKVFKEWEPLWSKIRMNYDLSTILTKGIIPMHSHLSKVEKSKALDFCVSFKSLEQFSKTKPKDSWDYMESFFFMFSSYVHV